MSGSVFPGVLLALSLLRPAFALEAPRELHSRLQVPASYTKPVAALTLDACSGQFDFKLVNFLIEHKIPATFFVTQRWLKKNPQAIRLLKSAPALFEIENHGALHRPAVLGRERRVFGLAGLRDLAELEQEVQQGAAAIFTEFAYQPRYFRGATARYDSQALQYIQSLGFQIAGFSLNADQGASLGKVAIVQALAHLQSGDIILAHANKPGAATGAALMVALPAARERGFEFVRLDAAKLWQEPAQAEKKRALSK